MPQKKIVITSVAEKWRLTCLAEERYGIEEGHTNWFPIDGKFRCRNCAEYARTDPEVDPEYEELLDKKTGRRVSRDDVVLSIDRRASASGI